MQRVRGMSHIEPTEDVIFPRMRVPAYGLANVFRAIALAAVPRLKGRDALRSQLERSTSAMVLSFGQAADGSDAKVAERLRAARDALDRSLMLLEQLVFEERLSPGTYRLLLARARTLLEWFDGLVGVPVAEWANWTPRSALTSAHADVPEGESTNEPWLGTLRGLLELVRGLLRTVQPARDAPGEPVLDAGTGLS